MGGVAAIYQMRQIRKFYRRIFFTLFKCVGHVHIVTGRPYPLRGSGERPPDGLPQRYEAAS